MMHVRAPSKTSRVSTGNRPKSISSPLTSCPITRVAPKESHFHAGSHGLREQSTSAPDKAAVIDAVEPVGGNQRRNQSRCRRSGRSHAQLTASHVHAEGQEHHEQISNPHE